MAENNFTQNATTDIVIDALMGVTDPAAVATDILLDQLIDALVNHYAMAAADVQKKAENYFDKFKELDKKKAAEVQAGTLSKENYGKWREQKMLVGNNYQELQKTLTSDMVHADQIAADIINDKKCDVYALNHNYGIYEVEHSLGADLSYVLYDHDTVERLVAENPKLLPKNKIDVAADKKWNSQKINNAITQGVLQGESIPDISKRLRDVTDMDKNAAIRNARTAVTGAQNAGRTDSYKHAEQLGIDIEQIWISTLDGRTRHSHRLLMGERRPVGKKFSNGLMFPGDPDGVGTEVYNCRCTLIADVDGTGYNLEKVIDNNLSKKGMTFDEWVNEKPISKHYGETKKHYLERYSEYKKNLSFADWMSQQALPDSMIQSVFGNKTWSNLFYEIYDKNHEDANLFKKELTKIADQKGVKPKDIWNQYLTGQLDAEDFNKFETALKKYAPQPDLDDHAKFLASIKDKSLFSSDISMETYNKIQNFAATDNIELLDYWKKYKAGELTNPELDVLLGYKSTIKAADKVEDIAKTVTDAESKLKFKKGSAMTKEGADTYKVNPFYNVADNSTQTNCQTAVFAYECRRQGYDVVALPYIDKNGNPLPGFEDIAKKQSQLSYDQSLGWINKKTGKAPISQLDSNIDYLNLSHNKTMDELEKMIGTNGERYSLAIRIKSDEGNYFSHVLNIDRTDSGALRIIDNQRGVGEINTWVGKDADDYLAKLNDASILDVFRLDDCIPNFEYFNDIVVDASKIKAKNSITINSYEKLNFTHQSKIMDALENANIPDLIDPLTGEINENLVSNYFTKWKYGLFDNSFLDNVFQATADTVTKTTVKTSAIDIEALKNKKVTAIYNELKAEVGTSEANAFYNKTLKQLGEANHLSQGDVWKKYLAGELDANDAAKIEKYLGKYKIDDTTDALKDSLKNKTLGDIFNSNESLWQDITEELNNKNKIGSFNAYWNHYVAGEINDPALDDILKKHLSKTTVEKVTEKADDIVAIAKKEIANMNVNTYMNIFDELEKIDTDLAIEFNGEIIKLKHQGYGTTKHEVLDAYLNGDFKSDKLNNIFTKFYGDKILKDKISKSPITTSDALDKFKDWNKKNYTAIPSNAYNKLSEIANDKNISMGDAWKKYLKGEIVDSDLDNYLGVAGTTVNTSGKLNFLKNKFGLTDIDDIADKLWQDGEIFNAVTKTNPTTSHMEYLIKYAKGEINNPEIDALLGMNKATEKVTTSPEVDLFALQNKSMSQVFNELKADKLNSKFYTELQKHGKPSEAWEKYLNGELSDEASKKIDNILIKKYSKGGISGQTTKTIQTAEKSEELIKAQEKLKKAQDELETIKKEIDQIPNKTYSGIWYQDVTLADYEVKQSALAAKKQYFYDQIEELEHCIEDPDSWQFKKYGGEEGLNKKIAEFEKHIDDLNEFEIKGKEYLDEKTKIDKKIKKAEKVIADAQDEVRQLTPVGEAFTQERKDAAVWAKNKTDEYKEVDKYFDKTAKKVHGSKTPIEHEGYYHYTWGSGPFNQPIAGFEGSWSQSDFKGVGKVDIDKNGYGDKIRGLTSLIEKSTYDKDFWCQSGQNQITLEAFLGLKPGTLRNMTTEELQQFVGVQNEIPQFISASVNRGGGSYNPGDMVFNIYCPVGSEALYVRSDGHFGKAEHEIILQRGGQYKIDKIYKSNGKLYVDLEVHPEYGYDKFQQNK